MDYEEKQLLLKDLCARIPNGLKAKYNDSVIDVIAVNSYGEIYPDKVNYTLSLDEVKPYLRSRSSMTEEEKRELQSFFPGSFGSQWLDIEKETIEIFECPSTMTLYLNDSKRVIDFFNSHHIDYLGFIEDGLALEAPEGMYKND